MSLLRSLGRRSPGEAAIQHGQAAVQSSQPLYTIAAGQWKIYEHTLATPFARMESMVPRNPANR